MIRFLADLHRTLMSARTFVALLLCASMAMALSAHAAETRVLIVREDTAVARQASELLAREFARLGWTSGEMSVMAERQADLRHEGEQALVALGPRAFAAALKQTGGRPLVAALIPRAAIDELPFNGAERWSAVVLDQPIDRWLSLVQMAFPGRQQIGVLSGPGSQKQLRALERRAAERRLAVAAETVVLSEDVVPALERLLPRMGLLLALPDPLVHNRNTVQPLLLTTYRAGIPVVAYSESYQQAGAALSLYSTVPQIAYQVVESLQSFLDGRAPALIQSPRYFTVGINNAVARSLGLQLPAATELQERLRAAD